MEVRRHRIGGARRQLPDAAPTGVFGAAKAAQQATPCHTPGLARGALRPPVTPPMAAPVSARGSGESDDATLMLRSGV